MLERHIVIFFIGVWVYSTGFLIVQLFTDYFKHDISDLIVNIAGQIFFGLVLWEVFRVVILGKGKK